jgi:hypothetical protein
MSVFENIMSSIFGRAKAQAAPIARGQTSAPSTAGGKAPGAGSTSGGTTGVPKSPATGAAQPQVDVEAVLAKLSSENKEKLDWRKSIVDLMKLLDLDTSLSARKELARNSTTAAIRTIPPK